LIRVSILFFYLGIAPSGFATLFRTMVWMSIVFLVVAWLIMEIILMVSCRPILASWHRSDPSWRADNHFTCVNHGMALMIISVAAVVMDLSLAALPLVLLWNLQIGKRKKLMICSLFALSLFPGVAATLRAYHGYKAWYDGWDFTCKLCPLSK